MGQGRFGRAAGTIDPEGPLRQEPDGLPIDAVCIIAMRTLSMNVGRLANSGHPAPPQAWLP
jgi:hypothetical protein